MVYRMEKMKYNFLLIIIILVFQSCLHLKASLPWKGDTNVAVESAITDFLRSEKRVSTDHKVFMVKAVELNNDIIGISIRPSLNKFYIVDNKPIYDTLIFPTKFYENNNKLFYWRDTVGRKDDNILLKLREYDHLDSVAHIGEVIGVIDH
ncbi:MAG: hypothetical protein ABIM30_10100, partial [candidate division WOR-3 bacterium]